MIPYDQNQTDWSSRLAYPDGTKTPWHPDKWVIHYGGGPNTAGDPSGRTPTQQIAEEQRVLRSWQSWHIDGRGWQDIAYNYAIGQSGTRYRLRGENRCGATKGDYENDGIPENYEARAVVFILGGDQEPTPAAHAAFLSMWVVDPMPVIGHRDVYLEGTGGTSTACPGEHLYTWLQTIGDDDMETLRIGDTGWGVSRLQKALNGWIDIYSADKTPLVIDGEFGQATADRVTQFQDGSKLPARYQRGVVGGITWGWLMEFVADLVDEGYGRVEWEPTEYNARIIPL